MAWTSFHRPLHSITGMRRKTGPRKSGCMGSMLGLHSVDEEGAFAAERSKLGGVAEPAARINLRCRRGVNNAPMSHVYESGGAEKGSPFVGRQELRGDCEKLGPRMAIAIVAIVVDKNPGRATRAENAEELANPAGSIRPVIRRFDRDYFVKGIGLSRNGIHDADKKLGIPEVRRGAAGAGDHLVGDVHADGATLRHARGNLSDQPASAAADVEDIIGWSQLHQFERRSDDGPMLGFHGFALTGFGPAIKFFAKNLFRSGISHSISTETGEIRQGGRRPSRIARRCRKVRRSAGNSGMARPRNRPEDERQRCKPRRGPRPNR